MTTKTTSTTDSQDLHFFFEKNVQQENFPTETFLKALIKAQGLHNPRLAQFWNKRGFDSAHFVSIQEIPAVPTDVFREIDLVSTEAPIGGVFRTSGTTSGRRGQHFHLSTRAYDAGAVQHFKKIILQHATSVHLLSIALDAEQHPDSSLSHMLRVFAKELGKDARSADFYYDDHGLRTAKLQDRIQAALDEQEPVILFGTAFGLADAMDLLPPMTLPAGSKIIQTGGFKGRREVIEAVTFYDALATHFDLPIGAILAEYGMTELSSQLYSDPTAPAITAVEAANRRLVAPPWCIVQAADPETLRVLPNGQCGLLRFTDCANIDSVAVIQTSDLGIVHDDGLELIGRHQDAVPRGCSLAIEEIRATQ